MTSLTIKDWEIINGNLHRLYRELDSQKHNRVMLEVLNELVPADLVVLQIADVQKPEAFSAITLPENHATPERIGLIGKYSHQSPFVPYYLATWDSHWKMTTDFMPLEDFYKTDLHRLALGPLGIYHQIFGVLGILDGTGYAIAISRTHQGFTEREREMLNVIQPHLVTSFINAAVCSRAQQTISQIRAAMETAPGAYGYFDAQGRLSWIQERAGAWLLEFFADEVKADGNIPQSVRQLISQSDRQGNLPQQLNKTVGEECLSVCLGNSPVGGWVMRLDRKLKTPPPHFHPLPQFSKRKNEVLKWMVEGKRNTEIATILGISPRTVEKHVQEILADLMVENRATAIVRAMEYCAALNQGMPITKSASSGILPKPVMRMT